MKIKVNVKWNKETYKNVEVDLEEPPEMFKIQLMSLTGVPIERQKVLTKGGRLGDSEWGKVVLKDGMTLMMMGTAEEATLPEKSEEPQFVEDLPEQVAFQCSKVGALFSVGLCHSPVAWYKPVLITSFCVVLQNCTAAPRPQAL